MYHCARRCNHPRFVLFSSSFGLLLQLTLTVTNLQEKLEGSPVAIQLTPRWRIQHPQLDSLIPRQVERKEGATMPITAKAARVLKQVREVIAHVQQLHP